MKNQITRIKGKIPANPNQTSYLEISGKNGYHKKVPALIFSRKKIERIHDIVKNLEEPNKEELRAIGRFKSLSNRLRESIFSLII